MILSVKSLYRNAERRVVVLFALVCSVVALGGCATDSRTMKLLLDAERIAQDSPEEAMHFVEQIDRSALRSQHDMARYRLVKSEVMYYNLIDSDSDSLTGQAVNYYMESEHHHEAARALYQHALVLQRQGGDHLAEAMVALIEAKGRITLSDDCRLRGLICRSMGDIYAAGCLFANALEAYAEAKELFDRAGLEYHSANVVYDMGAMQIQLREFESARELLEQALAYSIEVENRRFMCGVLHELLDLAIYMDDYQMCSEVLGYFEQYDSLLFGESHYMAAEAMLLSHRGMKHEAEALLDRAAEAADVEWADLEYARYIIYRNTSDSAKALYWEERSKHAQDRLMIEVLEQPVLNVQIEMLQGNVQAMRREQQLVRQRNTVIYSVIALVVVLAAYYLWRRMRRKNEDIAHYVETIHELSVALDSVPRELSSSLGVLYRDRFSELNSLCDIYYDHSGSSRHKNMVFNKLTETLDAIKSDGERFSELEAAVNEYRDGLLTRLKRLLPKLSERDYRVAVYSFAGFSARAISIFIDSDPVSVSKIKYNIKYKLKSDDSEDARLVVAALSEK